MGDKTLVERGRIYADSPIHTGGQDLVTDLCDEIERLQERIDEQEMELNDFAGALNNRLNERERLRTALDEIESYGGAQGLIAREALGGSDEESTRDAR